MSDGQQLTAAEAAARLGIKRQTLYAYVSRGLLERTVALDGRTSLFDPTQVDGLRQQRRRTADGEVPSIISSQLTKLSEEGHFYRGESVLDLVAADTDFETAADLLWESYGEWQSTDTDTTIIRSAQNGLPEGTRFLDRLRVSVAVLSATDPLRNDLTSDALAAAGRRMITGMVTGLPKLHLGRRERLADHLWLSLTPSPGLDEQRRAVNTALVLLADHGLATSTFAVRLAASVRADPYSLVSTGLGAVGGILHGVASVGVHRLLERAEEVGPEKTIGEELAAGRLLPGVGHTVYRQRDRRADALLDDIRTGWADDARLQIALDIQEVIAGRLPEPINIDFALGTLTWLLEADPDDATALFAIARTGGWLAHAIEELDEKPLRFRPTARYTGSP